MSLIVDDRQYIDKFQELTAFAREVMDSMAVPGITFGLWVNNREYGTGLGVTCINNPAPVNPETIFQVASITKTITATAIFRLIEQNKMRLDDPVRKYIPDFRVKDEVTAEQVTIRHLLNHTSGWTGNFFTDTGEDDESLSRYVKKMADLPQLTPPGSFYTYNNCSFNLAGYIIEIVTGKPYETAVQELVLDPLKMVQSTFFPDEMKGHSFAAGHFFHGKDIQAASPWSVNRASNPCGGLASTVPDLLRYARFHMGDGKTPDGERLLTPGSLLQMQTPEVPTEEIWMGLNWFIQDIEGVRFIRHNGSAGGQDSTLWMAPEKKLAFTVLTNLDPGVLLCEKLTKWVQKHYLGIVEPEPTLQVLSNQQLTGYTGNYQTRPEKDIFEVRLKNGDLTLMLRPRDDLQINDSLFIPGSPVHIVSYAPDRFFILDGPRKGHQMDFLRQHNGQITWLRVGGNVAVREENESV